LYLWLLKMNFYAYRKEKMPAFLFIMVLNTLKFTIQIEKKRIFIFKYCKIDVKSAATLIFAATLITAPTVFLDKSSLHIIAWDLDVERSTI
jgi:hypothetical protein